MVILITGPSHWRWYHMLALGILFVGGGAAEAVPFLLLWWEAMTRSAVVSAQASVTAQLCSEVCFLMSRAGLRRVSGAYTQLVVLHQALFVEMGRLHCRNERGQRLMKTEPRGNKVFSPFLTYQRGAW